MAQFKESLGQKLEALQLPQGTQVKIWVMDARPAAMSGIILAKPVCGS